LHTIIFHHANYIFILLKLTVQLIGTQIFSYNFQTVLVRKNDLTIENGAIFDPILYLGSITVTLILQEVLTKKINGNTFSCTKAIRRKKAVVMCNLAAERKSVPQVHMLVSLISTMGITRPSPSTPLTLEKQ